MKDPRPCFKAHLQVCHHFLHLGPADIQETLNQVSIYESRGRFRFPFGVERSPGAAVKEPNPQGITPALDMVNGWDGSAGLIVGPCGLRELSHL